MGREYPRTIQPEAVLDLIEAAYQVRATPEDWLRQIAETALEVLDFGCGLHAYLIDASNPDQFAMQSPIGVGLTPAWDSAWRANWWEVFMAPLDNRTRRSLHGFGACTYATDLWDAATSRLPDYARYLDRLASTRYGRTHARYVIGPGRPTGDTSLYPDSFNLLADDGSGKGCVLIANLPQSIRPWSVRELETLSRIANHLSAGLRLQLRKNSDPSRGPLDDAELILGVDGRVVHAAGRAEGKDMRAALRRTLLDVEQSTRRDARIPSESVLECWRALHHGRWSVLDRFDSDGKRFILARPNTPNCLGSPPAGLSAREYQVARLAESGHSNKTIAYELGLAESTVATHVRHIMHKIGTDSRVGLVTLLKAGHLPAT